MLLKEINRSKVIHYCLERGITKYEYISLSDVSELYEYFTRIHLKCTGYNYTISSDLRSSQQNLRCKYSYDKEYMTDLLLMYFYDELKNICWLRNQHRLYTLVDTYGKNILPYI